MRSLVAGVDDEGRSCIVEEHPIEAWDVHVERPSFRTDIYDLRESPPPQRPPAKAGYHETNIEPGHLEFLLLHMPAGVQHPHHHTDTLNFHTIVAGSVDLLLDDGPHRLDNGDSLVLPGVDHGWKAGPEGCAMWILNLGSIRPA